MSEPAKQEIQQINDEGLEKGAEKLSEEKIQKVINNVLKQEAGALQIGWSFDYVRGRVRDLGLKHGADVTYMILGQPVSHRLRSRPDRAPRRILLIANASQHQKRALQVVLDRVG